jgi:uncharacterized membrane protein
MQKWSDKHIESLIGTLLQWGVILASSIVLFGGILYLIRHGHSIPQYRIFAGEPEDLRTVSGILRDTMKFRARGIIQLGLLLLIATPVARVALSAGAFGAQRDRLYVAITLIVLVILVSSLIWGQG